MKLPAAVLMVAVSVGLAGCFSSNPSESDAKEFVLWAHKEHIDSGDLVVESVKKTDGKEMEMMGVKLYEMAVDVTAKYPKGYVCQSVPISAMNNFCSFMSKESIPQGTSITKSMRIIFEKSEKGWRGKFK